LHFNPRFIPPSSLFNPDKKEFIHTEAEGPHPFSRAPTPELFLSLQLSPSSLLGRDKREREKWKEEQTTV
jgi:hypothetical protein